MNDLKAFLDRKVGEYEQPSFIPTDPVSVPHRFSVRQDIEISGFFAALFSWGGRPTIINKSLELMRRMDGAPHDFVLHHSEGDLRALIGFCHRTFNDTDLLYFVHFLHHHYSSHPSLETAFTEGLHPGDETTEGALIHFHRYFFSLEGPARTRKHVSTPERGSACKRLSMFLRWMVRPSGSGGVDFGLWTGISPAQLVCPLDLHVARVARRFSLLTRSATDWKAALELTAALRRLHREDPVRYDFALFGLGIMERF